MASLTEYLLQNSKKSDERKEERRKFRESDEYKQKVQENIEKYSQMFKCRKKREADPDYVKKRFSNDFVMRHNDFKINKRAVGYHDSIKRILKYNLPERNSKIWNIIGCPLSVLKEHIEKQFLVGMSWDNFGEFTWQVRYKKHWNEAQTIFDLPKLFHYTNLKPSWMFDNNSFEFINKDGEEVPVELPLCNIYKKKINGLLRKSKVARNNEMIKIVGCSLEELKSHLKMQFEKNMQWHNFGERRDGKGVHKNYWGIEFITPMYFARNEDQIKKLCHFTNLKPSWNKNIKK